MIHRRISTTLALALAALPVSAGAQEAATACPAVSQLAIETATDDGSNDGHTPDLAIDGDFSAESRWSSEQDGKELTLDLGAPQTVEAIGLAFYKGDARTTAFSVATSLDGTEYAPLIDRTESGGETLAIERFEAEAPREARYVRLTGHGNSESAWNSVVEVQAYGCGSGEIESQGDGSDLDAAARLSVHGLDTTVPPADNFDLTRWKITLPVDRDGDGRADEIGETELAGGWSDETMFYTDPVTGGMVFRVVGGDASTPNSSYARVELRGMLRAGDESIPTREENGLGGRNNWVFSAAPQVAQDAAGGVDGTLRARLQVNRVTRQGDPSKAGRVIIGQIHARDDEPIRLYYRKLPTNKFGSIYYIHERDSGDIYVPVIGDRGDRIDNPADGIALDEVFGYEISVTGEEIDGVVHPILNVSITRDDGSVVTAPPLDMIDSPYFEEDEWMFFKAGAYSGNNTSPVPDRDFDQVTFFELEASHP